jgi:hypothetical protein
MVVRFCARLVRPGAQVLGLRPVMVGAVVGMVRVPGRLVPWIKPILGPFAPVVGPFAPLVGTLATLLGSRGVRVGLHAPGGTARVTLRGVGAGRFANGDPRWVPRGRQAGRRTCSSPGAHGRGWDATKPWPARRGFRERPHAPRSPGPDGARSRATRGRGALPLGPRCPRSARGCRPLTRGRGSPPAAAPGAAGIEGCPRSARAPSPGAGRG